VIVYCEPHRSAIFAEGSVEGRIAFSGSGTNGFGYDPIFIPNGYDCSFAELSSEEKNGLSHRGNALKNLLAQFHEEKSRA